MQAVERLRTFLQKYVEVLDPGTTIGLLAGYGRLDELMHYARCRGDWESLLEYLLQRQEVFVQAAPSQILFCRSGQPITWQCFTFKHDFRGNISLDGKINLPRHCCPLSTTDPQAERALEVLRRPSVSAELYYKFAPALVAQAPALTVQAWIDVQPPLEPR